MAQGNPVLRGTLIAVAGLLFAGLLGWGMMSIGAGRLRDAEKTKEPLRQAVSFLAGDAIAAANEADLAISNKNWGETQKPLRRVDEVVTALEKSATPDTQEQVTQIRAAL